jgi:hypothetical protein
MIYNEDCVSGAIKHLKSESVDLGIHDPPFGIPVGFEINPESFSYWNEKLDNIEQGCKLRNLKVVENVLPKNQGKKITDQEINEIVADYHKQIKILKTKKEVVKFLCDKYGRGRFGIENILDKSIAV